MKCSHCGLALGIVFQDNYRLVIRDGQAVQVGAVAFKITQIVKEKMRTQPQLLDALYGSDPGGGPDWADSNIWASISVANKRLAKIGLRIKGNRRGRGALIGLYDVAGQTA